MMAYCPYPHLHPDQIVPAAARPQAAASAVHAVPDGLALLAAPAGPDLPAVLRPWQTFDFAGTHDDWLDEGRKLYRCYHDEYLAFQMLQTQAAAYANAELGCPSVTRYGQQKELLPSEALTAVPEMLALASAQAAAQADSGSFASDSSPRLKSWDS